MMFLDVSGFRVITSLCSFEKLFPLWVHMPLITTLLDPSYGYTLSASKRVTHHALQSVQVKSRVVLIGCMQQHPFNPFPKHSLGSQPRPDLAILKSTTGLLKNMIHLLWSWWEAGQYLRSNLLQDAECLTLPSQSYQSRTTICVHSHPHISHLYVYIYILYCIYIIYIILYILYIYYIVYIIVHILSCIYIL